MPASGAQEPGPLLTKEAMLNYAMGLRSQAVSWQKRLRDRLTSLPVRSRNAGEAETLYAWTAKQAFDVKQCVGTAPRSKRMDAQLHRRAGADRDPTMAELKLRLAEAELLRPGDDEQEGEQPSAEAHPRHIRREGQTGRRCEGNSFVQNAGVGALAADHDVAVPSSTHW